jgi:hypothetical protein
MIPETCARCKWSAKVSVNDKENRGWYCGKYPTDNTLIRKTTVSLPIPPKWCPLRKAGK